MNILQIEFLGKGKARVEFRWTGQNKFVSPALRADVLKKAGVTGKPLEYRVVRRGQVCGTVQTDVTYFLEPIKEQPVIVEDPMSLLE